MGRTKRTGEPRCRGSMVTGASLRRWRSQKRDISSSSEAGTDRFSPDTGVLWLLDHRQGQGGSRGRDPRTRQDHPSSDHRNAGVPRSTTTALSPLGALRCRRWLDLSIPGHLRHRLRQVHRGRCALFGQSGITTVFTNLEGFPEDWKENPDSFVKFVREHHYPSFLEYGDIRTSPPMRSRRRCA